MAKEPTLPAGEASVWSEIKDKLREMVAPAAYDKWIEPLPARAVSPSEIVVTLPNLVFFQGIHNEYMTAIERCKAELGYDHVLLRLEVEGSPLSDEIAELLMDGSPAEGELTGLGGGLSDEPSDAELADGGEAPRPSAVVRAPRVSASGEDSGGAFSRSLSAEGNLNRNYTFDNFVRGDSNQFAVATCLSAAENPGKAYNPLFIYGSTGLGKTHLLHAVGNRVLANNPGAVVTYIPSERFMNEMIYCIRFNKMFDFRQKYRNCDVFLVDDIQFISGKRATQEEFFHTFNSLYAAKKQIVITSDLFPKDIPDIEDRLRNRFQWGLIADIQPPSIEHRIAILQSKAEELGIELREDVAEYIATQFKRNVRELEGALKRINAFGVLQGEKINMDLAHRTFKDVLGEPPKRLTIEIVQKTVAEHFKLRVADIKSKKRQRAFALPRQIAMYLARKLTNSSFPEIGDKFGGKDHTTVMHNVRKIEGSLGKDLDLKAHVESLERHLEQLQ